MMSNKNCGPDIVKYFVVEPSGGGSITGATGDFYVCQGTTFLKTISGCTDSVNLNDNIFYNDGDVFFNGVISACTGIQTSSIRGCSPITVFDTLNVLKGITTISGDTTLLATSATTLTLTNLPSVNNTATQILARNSTTGLVEYRDVNTITPDTNTFVTGFTYDNVNTFTISQNDGSTFDATISVLSGITYYGDGSNLTGISTEDKFVSGGTYNIGTQEINFAGNSPETTFDVDLTSLVASVSGDTNTFVTGFTFNNTTYDLTIKQNNGEPDLVSNLAVLASDVYVVSGVYDPATGIVTYTNSSGGTFQVSGFTTGMTDSYTTDAYLNGTEIRFDNNIQGVNFYNVDLLPLLSGKTDNTTFNTYTANTQTILDSKIDSVNNVGGANELFKDKSGTTLNFRTLSGGSNTTVSTVGDVVKVDVTIPADTNTFVTGGTYSDVTDTITLTRNDGGTIDITGVTDTFTTGATYDNGTALATFTKNDGTTYTLDLSTIDVNDTFVTGTTFSSNQAVVTRNDGVGVLFLTGGTNVTLSNPSTNQIKVDVAIPADTNTFVTGFTYNDANTFTISRNDGVDLSASINTMTGLTVNGSVSATTYFGDGSNLTGISTDDNFVTGGTLNSGTLTLERQNGIVTITGFTNDVDTFSTGGTVTQSATSGSSQVTIQITGNDGFTPYNITGLTDTFVNDFSFSSNTFTITQNDGSTFEADVDTIDLANILSAVTFNIATTGTISATTFNGNTFNGGTFNGTFVGDGSGLTGITDNFVSGGTYNAGTLDIDFVGNSPETTFSVDLSSLVNNITGDTFVTGTTFSSNQATVTRNDGFNVLQLTGGTNVTLTNPSTNQIKIDVNIPADTNTFVTGGTYNDTTDIITLTRNDGGIINITGVTDTFVTGTTFTSNQAIVGRNDGFDVLSLSGTNDVTLTNPSSNQIVIDVNGLKYFISETNPTGVTLSNGYRWFNTSIGSEFVYIDDGDSSQWVQPLIQPGPQGPQGPSGNPYFITTGITTSAETLTTGFTYYGVSYVGDVDLTLPDPTGIDGFNFTVKDEGGNAGTYRIRLIPSVGLIDGNTSVDMANNYMGLYLVARNNNWWII